jgi:hypothetical protein
MCKHRKGERDREREGEREREKAYMAGVDE